jgi:mono/diheme cytochrome c family protein
MRIVVILAVLAGSLQAPAQEKKKPDAQAKEVSFARDVLPILKASCAKCHDAKNKKGSLDLSSYDTVKKGGKGGAAFAAGEPDKSPLVSEISGDKPSMPKKATPLKKEQVDLISKWVKDGAKNN